MKEYPEDERGDPMDRRDIRSNIREAQLWYNIKLAAKTNPILQEALDRAVILYELGKK
jgi:hypothetical protein